MIPPEDLAPRPAEGEAQYFKPLRAWTWNGQVYESDSAGLAYHRSACAVSCCTDEDEDCICGAHELNKWIIANA